MVKRTNFPVIARRILLLGRQDDGVSDADAEAFFAAIGAQGGTIGAAAQAAVIALFGGLKTDGVWSSLIAVCPLVGDQLAAGTVAYSVPGASAFVMTNTNFVAADYAPASGLQGDGLTKYLDTTVSIPALSQTHISFGAWELADSTGSAAHTLIGSSYNASGDTDRCYIIANSTVSGGEMGLGADGGLTRASTGSGWYLQTYDGAHHSGYRGTTSQFSIATSSLIWQRTGTFLLLDGAATGFFSDARVGFAVVGGALTAAQNAALVARITAFFAAIGRA